MSKTIGIFCGSTTGNTETVAKEISDVFGADMVEINDIAEASVSDLDKYQYLIFGSSTWGMGDLQDDWYPKIDALNKINYSGKKIALFGTGDQERYPDTFLDAVGIIYEKLKAKNATIVGFFSTEGFDFNSSRAVVDNKFVGLAIDNDNQAELTEERIKNWVVELQDEFV